MPIYEFYCPDCHTIYNFFARRPDSNRQPNCPRCRRKNLTREISRFAISKGRTEPGPADEGLPADFDEAKVEQLVAGMEGEMSQVNEDDPRQVAQMMRKLSAFGIPLGRSMKEAIRRMESGEDLEKIEEDLGDALENDEALFAAVPGKKGRLSGLAERLKAPRIDETLYDL